MSTSIGTVYEVVNELKEKEKQLPSWNRRGVASPSLSPSHPFIHNFYDRAYREQQRGIGHAHAGYS